MRIRTAFLLVLFFAPVLLYAGREPLLVAGARALTVDDARGPADYIVVLSGGSETRPFAAAELYRRGLAPRVVIFHAREEPGPDVGAPALTQVQIYRRVLEMEGVPAAAIAQLPGRVDSTRDEARALRRLLVAHPARRVIIVTSPEHTRRARWTFQKTLTGMAVEVRMAPARHPRFDETNWWRHDVGALAYIHEFLKFPYYWIRHLMGDLVPQETSALTLHAGAAPGAAMPGAA